MPEACRGACISLALSRLQENLLGCSFAVALRKLKVVLLSKGQFPPSLRGGISALIFFDSLSPEPTDGIGFHCIKPPVLSYLEGILDFSGSW